MPTNGREPSLGELADDMAELKAILTGINVKIDNLPFVRLDVYEARRAADRAEMELKIINIRTEVEGVSRIAEVGRTLGVSAVFVLIVAVLAGVVTFAIQGGAT